LLFDWAPRHEGELGEWRYSFTHSLTSLGTRWRWVVSFTPRPIYSQGKSPWYPLDRRLSGLQSRCGRGGEDKNSQPRRESNPITPIVQLIAQNNTAFRHFAFPHTQ
jgi:hypothetical protein